LQNEGAGFEHLNDQISIDNRMMRLYDECSLYLDGIKANQTAYEELTSFENSKHIKKIIDKIKDRYDMHKFDEIDSGKKYHLYFIIKMSSQF
jgi:hypothetical protein